MNTNTAKAERLLYALTYIDEKLILAAAPKMKKKKNRLPLKSLSIAASLMMVIAALSAVWISGIIGNNPPNSNPGIITDPAEESFGGLCGDALSWTLESKQPLVISGTGYMYDYTDDPAPWIEHRKVVKSVTIENGVTSIGSRAFADCTDMISIVISESVEYIANDAFDGCNDFYIVCNNGSYASHYAEENGIPTVTPNGNDTEKTTDTATNVAEPETENYVVNFGTEGLDLLQCLEDMKAFEGNDGIIYLKANDAVIEISREAYSYLDEIEYSLRIISVCANGRTKLFEEPIYIHENRQYKLYQTKDYFVFSSGGAYTDTVVIWTENDTVELSAPRTDPDDNPIFYNEACYFYQVDGSGRLSYSMTPYKFLLIGGEWGYLLPHICSFDELYREEGYITVKNGKVVYHPEKRYSVTEIRADFVYEMFDFYSQNNLAPCDEFETLEELMEHNKAHYEEFKCDPDLRPY